MKSKYIILLSVLIFPILILLAPLVVCKAVDQSDLDDLQAEERKLEKKLADAQNRENTLANEIAYVNDQVALAELKIRSSVAKIAKTQSDIDKLEGDIDSLKDRIDKLAVSIDYQQKLLDSRMRESYKSRDSSVILLFGADSLGNLVQKLEYLQVVEKHDNELLEDMRKTKEAFTTQKRLFEEKKSEVESLKRTLENEKADLDAQKGSLVDKKAEKQKLLEITQNDEAKYQKMLADVRRELNQITGAVSVLKNSKAVKVKKGDVIGIQGNTGYSFGEHLHFGVYKYSSFRDIDGWNWYYSNSVDPEKMLKKKTVYWDTGCEGARSKTVGNGDWSWPMSNPTITQDYGYTCWSKRYYGGNEHPAFDMAGPSGSRVFAVDDGQAYACRNCLGDGANGVFIFHENGYMTVYWHLRSF